MKTLNTLCQLRSASNRSIHLYMHLIILYFGKKSNHILYDLWRV